MWCPKYDLKHFTVFWALFWDSDKIGSSKFFGDLFSYFKRVNHLLPRLQVSDGVLRNFFPTNLPWSQKTRGSWGRTPFLLLEKLYYIMKFMPPPKKPFLDRFPSFFFVRSMSSKSNLIFNYKLSMYSVCRSAQFFHQKNGPQKCCNFADLLQRN